MGKLITFLALALSLLLVGCGQKGVAEDPTVAGTENKDGSATKGPKLEINPDYKGK